jgi:NAD(P)-dependent dehydrogenase (short-subunit alcohol dehydrogenase family)
MKLLDERRALVTGGANGIGRAIVARFVAEGAAVAAVDVEPVEGLGANVLGFRRDLSETENLDALVDDVEEALGPLDVLVNNAGIYEPAQAVDLRRIAACWR